MPTAVPISSASVALGLGAAAVLFGLHCLRARSVRRAVATLIFWQGTIREQKARTLWSRRFTHVRTFLLLTFIALLFAASLSADRWAPIEIGRVVVVDNGISTAAIGPSGRTLLAGTIERVESDLRSLPSSPTVVTAGGQPAVVVASGTPLRVCTDQLSRLTPSGEATNAMLSLQLGSNLLGNRGGTIDWYTDRSSLPDGLPAEIAEQVRLHRSTAPAEAVSIAGVVFTPAAANASSGTLRVKLAGRSGRPVTINATLGGELRQHILPRLDGAATVSFEGVAATGELATMELPTAPGSPGQHSAAFRLPKRPPLRFCVVGDVPLPLRQALSAVGTEAASPSGCVVVCRQGQPVPAGAAGVIFVTPAETSVGTVRPIAAAADAASMLGSIDFEGATVTAGAGVPTAAASLLVAGPVTIAGLETTAAGPRLYLSEAMVNEAADLPRHAAFPVLIDRLAHRLVDWQPARPVLSARRLAEDPLWSGPSPVPGTTTVVFDPPITAVPGVRGADADPSDAITARGSWPLAELLISAGLGLLVVEAALLSAKKII